MIYNPSAKATSILKTAVRTVSYKIYDHKIFGQSCQTFVAQSTFCNFEEVYELHKIV